MNEISSPKNYRGYASAQSCRRRNNGWINTRHWGVGARRSSSRFNAYVDWYEAPLLAAALITLICSVLDAYLTLTLIELGGVELNYLMDNLMRRSQEQFVTLKVALTGLGVIFLVVHKNFSLFMQFRVGHLLHAVAAGYLALIGYQYLLLQCATGS
jgi:hypothetical protein